MRISDWSSDVCSSDLYRLANQLSASLTKIAGLLSKSIFAELVKVRASADAESLRALFSRASLLAIITGILIAIIVVFIGKPLLLLLAGPARSEEHTSELQSLMRNSYTVFCLKQ